MLVVMVVTTLVTVVVMVVVTLVDRDVGDLSVVAAPGAGEAVISGLAKTSWFAPQTILPPTMVKAPWC